MLASPTALKDYLFTDPEAEYQSRHYGETDISRRELAAPAGARYLRKPDENEGRSHGAVGPRAFVMPLMDVDQMNLGPRFSARTRFKLPRMCQRPKAIMDVLADHLGDIGLEDGWDDPQVTPDGSIKCGCLAEFPDITKWRAPRHRHPQSPLPYFLLTKPAGPEAEYQLEHYVPVDISLFVCIIRNNQRKFRISTEPKWFS